jgi:hypothetical protein
MEMDCEDAEAMIDVDPEAEDIPPELVLSTLDG